jgi:prephenate dehydrogenase
LTTLQLVRKKEMTVTIIGTGLIGGSAALVLRQNGFAARFIGVENNEPHAVKALDLGIVDEINFLEEGVTKADLIIIATPADAAVELLPKILNMVQGQVVTDMCSTKLPMLEAVQQHPRRRRYVATHPMWGTEYSGPGAAVSDAFKNKAVIICNESESDADALETVKQMYSCMQMHLLYMDAAAHDLHAAYVSHISHITSFALANTVLEKEKEDDAIFEMASAGFESTVRLAKSNPAMWIPIFKQNRENVLDVLNEHITQLRKFKSCLEKENYDYLKELIENANKIRRILK